MTNKKSRFWTFIFSMIPGAGEMYMGFFRHGISVMGLFFLTIALAGFLNLGPLIFLLPIIWFYSFFHVHSLKSLPDEEFYAVEDDFIFPFGHADYSGLNLNVLLKKHKKLVAVILIVIGLSILWNNLLDLFRYFLPDFMMEAFWNLTYQLPQTIIGILLIILGLYLISGKKKMLEGPVEEPKQSYESPFGYQKDMDYFQTPEVPDETKDSASAPTGEEGDA